MDDWRPNRAAKKAAMPASSILLASTFHASIIFALLWLPLAKPPASVPDDAVELTIEPQPVAMAEPPVVSPPVQPPEPVPEPSAPQAEPAQVPTLESAVPEPEPAPQLTLRDFPKTEPVIAKTEQKKPIPKADPKPQSNKAPVPPAEGKPQTASPPTPAEPSGCPRPQQKKRTRSAAVGHKVL